MSQDFRRKGSSLGNIFGFYKTRHILLSDSANCTVLRAVVLTQYRRVTDGRTDRRTRIAIASTALAMRALLRAVKTRITGRVHTSAKPPPRLTSVALSARHPANRFMSVNHFPYLRIVTNPENNLCIQTVILIATKI